MNWTAIFAPPDASPPKPWTMRVQAIAPHHYFAAHSHAWHQVVYAIKGVLTVVADGRSFAITPDRAVWIPAGTVHQVGSFLGAEFHGFWLVDNPLDTLQSPDKEGVHDTARIFAVSPLLKALIVEAAGVCGEHDDEGYCARLYRLTLDQLHRSASLDASLAWPHSPRLAKLCEALYIDPTDARGPDQWGQELGMSGRTLARRFFAETGVPLRTWRRQLKIFRAIEMLENEMSITRIAFDLGYSSASAFVYAFRTEMQCSPLAYMQARLAHRFVHRPPR